MNPSAASRNVANHLENGQGVAVQALRFSPVLPRAGSSRPVAPAIAGAALAAVVLAVTACGAAKVRPAPFRARPDSVDPGSLLGPFDGKVVDAGTGEPVTGALVYATWTFQSGTALQSPSGYREAVTLDRRRRPLPARPRSRGLPGGGRVADFNLVIYKRGYVAYRSDRRFDDLGPRLDFAQRQNLVRLDKWRSEYSHVRHLRFVGGGPAIAALTRWEMPEAAAELAGVKAGPRVATDLVVGGQRRAGRVAGAERAGHPVDHRLRRHLRDRPAQRRAGHRRSTARSTSARSASRRRSTSRSGCGSSTARPPRSATPSSSPPCPGVKQVNEIADAR